MQRARYHVEVLRPIQIAALGIAASGVALLAGEEQSYSDAEIRARLAALEPKAEELRFSAPEGWPRAPVAEARVAAVSAGEDRAAAVHAVDGTATTTWTTRQTRPAPEVVLDFPVAATFNRAVIYNRFTTQRGPGVGNNALRTVELLVPEAGSYRSLGTFELGAPTATCFRRTSGSEVCAFANRREPDILVLPPTTASRVVVRLVRAHWNDGAPEEWKTSFALSEVSFWDVPTTLDARRSNQR